MEKVMTAESQADLERIYERIIPPSSTTVLVGPISWLPTDGLHSKLFNFVIVSGSDGERHPRIDAVKSDNAADLEALRMATFAAILCPKRLIVDFGDDLEMAEMAHMFWPRSRRIEKIMNQIKAERARN